MSTQLELLSCERHCIWHTLLLDWTKLSLPLRYYSTFKSRSLSIRPHSQHLHLNCHFWGSASSQSHNGLFRPETSPALPCLDTLCLEPALFSLVSYVLDLHVAHLTAEVLTSTSPHFISLGYYLKLTCPLPYLIPSATEAGTSELPLAHSVLG